MERREIGRQSITTRPLGQLKIESIFRIECLPIGRLGSCQDIGHRQRFPFGGIRTTGGFEQYQEQREEPKSAQTHELNRGRSSHVNPSQNPETESLGPEMFAPVESKD